MEAIFGLIAFVVSFALTHWWQSAIVLIVLLVVRSRLQERANRKARIRFLQIFGHEPCGRYEKAFAILQRIVDEELAELARRVQKLVIEEERIFQFYREGGDSSGRDLAGDLSRLEATSKENGERIYEFWSAYYVAQKWGFNVRNTRREYLGKSSASAADQVPVRAGRL